MSAAKSINRGARILEWEGKRGVYMARRSLEFSSVVSKEGKWYVAHCPELEITSQGKSVESALENLREAIELYLQDEDAEEAPECGSSTVRRCSQ